MKKKLNIFILLFNLCICLSACGAASKQYEIELISPDTGASINEAEFSEQMTDIPEDEKASLDKEANSKAKDVFIHLCGAVLKPGVYEVPEGSRIFEVLNLAGGFSPDAARETVNLAMTVTDGSMIRIPTLAEAESEALSGREPVWLNTGEDNIKAGSGPVSNETELININTAALDALMTLPGIGKAKAQSIISYREEKGKFIRIEDIMKINGIKDAVFSKIKDKICV